VDGRFEDNSWSSSCMKKIKSWMEDI